MVSVSGRVTLAMMLAAVAALCVAACGPGFVLPPPSRKEAGGALRGASEQQWTTAEAEQRAATGSLLFVPLAVAFGAAAAFTAGRRFRGKSAAPVARTVTALHAFEQELGVQAPVGFWDPMGFTKDGDVEDFKRRRATEIKHGRVSMFAAIGYIVPEYYKFPGFLAPSAGLKFQDVPNGLAAFNKVPTQGWLQILALGGFYEFCVNTPTDEPGNFGKGFLGFTGSSIDDPAKRSRSLNAELANGRLAMIAIMGMIFQNGTAGATGPAMWGMGAFDSEAPATTMRAAPKILEGTGGPFPQDFWDPAGLAKGKSDEQLLHWRAVEIKHGRVCMLAALGWFHVAAGWHPIGDFAVGVRLSNDPLISVTQMPMGAIWQVVFTIMCFEWLFTVPCPPPKDKPWDILGWDRCIYDDTDQEWKDAQMRELNNGRLAMVGIIGLIVQDAYTGEYVQGISQTCLGNVICKDTDNWSMPFPPTPFKFGPFYPGQSPIFPFFGADGNAM